MDNTARVTQLHTLPFFYDAYGMHVNTYEARNEKY